MLIGFAPRSAFGLFQIPIADELGWGRSTFSLAIAIQNLAWGFGQPIFAAIAERWGDRRAIALGILLYALGLFLTSNASSPGAMQALEVLVGFGIAGMGFGVVLAMIGRAASDNSRSLALGIATAAGSAGQVVGPPFVASLLGAFHWREVFLILTLIMIASFALLMLIPRKDDTQLARSGEIGRVVKMAMGDPSYQFIFMGFFSCGFQLAFITAHFPAMVAEFCAPIAEGSLLARMGVDSGLALGGFAMSVIGLLNIFGSIVAGYLGRDFSKKYLLFLIYCGRTLIAAWFILTPMTPISVLIFSMVMGALWLATVPLTSGLVGAIYGLRFMGTLYGLVFLSHQIGSFLGVYIGGVFYDRFGSYDVVWWVGILVGLFSAIIHLPIRERPDERFRALSARA